MTDKQPEALQVPLHELLEAIPEDWRIGVKDNDDWSAGTTWHPVGVMCHQAATELRRLHEVNAELVEALCQLIDDIDSESFLFEGGCGVSETSREQALAAIAKATGEQS
jgi:hypothetical protein